MDDKKIKIWGSLFTCLTTRAIHLEVVTDLTSEKFLNSFRRFVARRGVPCIICSDNATTFKGANKVVESLWNKVQEDSRCCDFVSSNKIRWHFITPLSPWKGGYYKRMVGTVKSSLKRAIGKKVLAQEDYQTLLCGVEGVVNSRPLTYIYEENNAKILRPVDFLLPKSCLTLPSQNDWEDNDETYLPPEERNGLVERYKQCNRALDRYWDLWKKEYLLSLREKHRMEHGQFKSVSVLPRSSRFD